MLKKITIFLILFMLFINISFAISDVNFASNNASGMLYSDFNQIKYVLQEGNVSIPYLTVSSWINFSNMMCFSGDCRSSWNDVYNLNISADSGTDAIYDSEILTVSGGRNVTTSIVGNVLTINAADTNRSDSQIIEVINTSSYYDIKVNCSNIEGNDSATFCAPSGGGSGSSVSSNQTFGLIVGFTSSSYSGNLSNSTHFGYERANLLCDSEYSGSHFCLEVEIMKTNIVNSTISGQYWMAKGAPGYTANANDCEGWTKTSGEIGPYWDYTENSGVGAGKLTPCSSTLQLACCGGDS